MGKNLNHYLLSFFVAIILFNSSSVQAAEVRPSSIAASWLDTVNYYRLASDLPPVKEDPQRTAMSKAHVNYLANTPKEFYVGAYESAHTENPASPFYSELGAKSGSNIAWSNLGTESNFIDQWMAAPFHTMGILRENLETSGFAVASGPATASYVGALDVFGINYSKTQAKTIVFPGNNSTVRLNSFKGESPDPRESCGSDWKNFKGLPLFVSFPKTLVKGTTGSLTLPDGKTLTPGENLCIVDQFNFVTSDRIYGPAGKSIMASDKLVLVIPKDPLAAGEYIASVTQASNQQITWKFKVLPKLQSILFLDKPERDQIEWQLLDTVDGEKIKGYLVSQLKDGKTTSVKVDGKTDYFDTSTMPDGWNFLCIQPFDESRVAECSTFRGVYITRTWNIRSTQFSTNDVSLRFSVTPSRNTPNLVTPNIIVIFSDENDKELSRREVPGNIGSIDLTEFATGKEYNYCLVVKGNSEDNCVSGWFKFKKPQTPSNTPSTTKNSSNSSKPNDGYPTTFKVPGRSCPNKGATSSLFEVKLKCVSLNGALKWARADGKSTPVLPLGTTCSKAGEKIVVLNREYLCKVSDKLKIWLPAKKNE
jgi:hypothetical protein